MEIDMHKFYTIGVWCFGIIALMNTMSFVSNYRLGNFYLTTMMVSSIASLVFNYAIFGFFVHLKRGLPPKNIDQAPVDEMLTVFAKEVKK